MSINEVKITYCPPYVQPEKRQYNKVADAFCALASTGSANPGIQYTQALLDAIDEERTSSFTIESLDRLSEAEMVLTAWQHRLRYRIHRNPIGPHLAPRTWFNPKDE